MLTATSARSGTSRSTGSLSAGAPGGMAIVGLPPKVRTLSVAQTMLARHRCDKGVTAAGDVGDEAVAAPSVTERPAQRGNIDPQRALVHNRVGPGAGDELILVKCFTCALNERY